MTNNYIHLIVFYFGCFFFSFLFSVFLSKNLYQILPRWLLTRILFSQFAVSFRQYCFFQYLTLRAILFRPKQFPTTLLYSNLNILKLDDMINMEFAKFMFKFNNKMLHESFDGYFTILDNIHKHNTRQKHCNEYYQFHTSSESGKKLFSISA